jgi:hypothetical protein
MKDKLNAVIQGLQRKYNEIDEKYAEGVVNGFSPESQTQTCIEMKHV